MCTVDKSEPARRRNGTEDTASGSFDSKVEQLVAKRLALIASAHDETAESARLALVASLDTKKTELLAHVSQDAV